MKQKRRKSIYIKTKELCTVPEIPHQRAAAGFPIPTVARDLVSEERSAALSTKNNLYSLNHTLTMTRSISCQTTQET